MQIRSSALANGASVSFRNDAAKTASTYAIGIAATSKVNDQECQKPNETDGHGYSGGKLSV